MAATGKSKNKSNIHTADLQNPIAQKNEGAKFDQTVEVLYQKMGDRWFAFSVIEDEIFIGSISQEEIDVGPTPAGRA